MGKDIMVQDNKESNTDMVLGEIKGTVKAIDQKLKAQNGAINGMRESINGLSSRVDKLPCEIQTERINSLMDAAEKDDERESQEQRDKGQWKRGLLIAIITALLTGGFMLLGIWLSRGAPLP
jgi:hypothetical protein